ncbi:MAG: hypothetical protein QOI27_2509 [Gaiellaceae bacterium]|jgi:hypothetical protein|nr:hypothetical protein [Gaiellaceae bacterium]MDX6473761.1 hypothetical protein [Gaiellaceae bacterium]
MTPVADTWDGLRGALFGLRDAVLRARLAVADAPTHGRVLIVDTLTEDIAELAGICEETLALVAPEPDDRPRTLAQCQRRLASARTQYVERIATYELLTDLLEVGRYRGYNWDAWAVNVKDAIEGFRGPLDDAGIALVECLLEIAERSAPPPVAGHPAPAASAVDVTTPAGGRYA